MSFPSDREYAELQKDAEQRRLMRRGRGVLVFSRFTMFVFLAIGIVLLLWASKNIFLGLRAIDAGTRQNIVFLLFWNLIVLSMIWLVSKNLATIKREKEAEQNLERDIVKGSPRR
jgi:hypothetical protein